MKELESQHNSHDTKREICPRIEVLMSISLMICFKNTWENHTDDILTLVVLGFESFCSFL